MESLAIDNIIIGKKTVIIDNIKKIKYLLIKSFLIFIYSLECVRMFLEMSDIDGGTYKVCA